MTDTITTVELTITYSVRPTRYIWNWLRNRFKLLLRWSDFAKAYEELLHRYDRLQWLRKNTHVWSDYTFVDLLILSKLTAPELRNLYTNLYQSYCELPTRMRLYPYGVDGKHLRIAQELIGAISDKQTDDGSRLSYHVYRDIVLACGHLVQAFQYAYNAIPFCNVTIERGESITLGRHASGSRRGASSHSDVMAG